jgi:hypothetical protein
VLFVSVNDPPARQIVWRHLHRHPVAGQNFDVIHPHFAGNSSQNNMPILQTNFKVRIGEGFCHFAVLFDQIFFCHIKRSGFSGAVAFSSFMLVNQLIFN